VLGIVVVALLVLLNAPPTTRFVVNKLLPKINQKLNGRLTVTGVSGSLLSNLQLRGVTLRDPEGQVVLQADRVNVSYSVWDLVHGRIALGPLLLERPIVRLLKDHPGEQYSILRVFQSEDSSSTKAGSVDLTIQDVTLRDGAVVATVWRQPAAPQLEQAQQLDTVQLQNVNVSFPLIHYSSGPTLERAAIVEIAAARAYLADPELELDELQGEARMRGDSMVIALRTIRLPASHLSADAWLVTAPNDRRFDATAHIEDLVAADFRSFIKGADIPPDWRVSGTLRTISRGSGAVVVTSPDIRIAAAGGTISGHLTVTGRNHDWSTEDSRLDVAGIEVERLLRAFHIPSNLRATIDGFMTADGRSGTADLELAGAAGYGVRGPLRGRIRASGGFEALTLDTRLTGSIGDVALSAQIEMGKHLAVHQLRGDMRRLDLSGIVARMPRSDVNGHLEGDVLFGSMPREGMLRLWLDSSMVRGVPIDTAIMMVHAENGLLTTDSLLVRAPGLRMTGTGTFGLTEDQTGDFTLTLDAPSLTQVEPVLVALKNDTVAHLDGALQAALTAKGSLKSYTLDLDARGHDLAMKGFQIDSLTAAATGTPDSLTFELHSRIDSLTAVNLAGRAVAHPAGRLVGVDSLTVHRRDVIWSMAQGSHVQMAGGKWELDSVVLARNPGPGQLVVNGAVPGQVSVRAEALPVADILGTGKRDSLPDLDATATYAAGVARGQVSLVTNNRKPLALDFVSTPLHANLDADSLDLGIFGPLVPSVKALGGALNGKITIDGPTNAPRLDGRLELSGGKASVPATGVRYHDFTAALTFAGDAMRIEQMHVLAGKGNAQLDGQVRFTTLDKPELQIAVQTARFPLMNRHDFLEATTTGDLHVTGSPAGAVLNGNAHVDQGNAYLEKFMRSSGIDLSDSLYAQFVDTTVLREAVGGSGGFVEAMMDSLRIDSVSVDLGDNFWLKSPDASIQLAGQLTVSTAPPGAPREAIKTEKPEKYRLVGTVRAVRGLYQMTFAPGLTREFTIREGSIRYFGSPRRDAELNLNAEHVVRTANGDEVTVRAHIGGTLEQPTIALASDVSPPLSETELISYLVFGAPTAQAFLGDEGENSQHSTVFEKSAQQLANVLSGKLESAVISQLGLPLDYFRIKPGEVQSGLAGTELVLGMQVRVLGYPSFLRASPRFCPREQLLSLDHIGIDLETRLSKQWGVSTSVDPLQTCESLMSGLSARPYQFGFDLFWEKR